MILGAGREVTALRNLYPAQICGGAQVNSAHPINASNQRIQDQRIEEKCDKNCQSVDSFPT
jgi:hypothetical protein